MVIVRCIGPEEFFLERVVFPFELLSFTCPPLCEVEIWTHGLGGTELVERMSVAKLIIDSHPSEAQTTGSTGEQHGDLVNSWMPAV